MDVLEERGIAEFELEKDGVRIRVKRGTAPSAALTQPPSIDRPTPSISALDSSSSMATAAPTTEPSPASTESGPAETTEGLYIIKSPIVGTFYAAPAPNAPPFVKLGDVVEVGQVLCIIEAMKLMNEIEAEVGGEIVKIYVENGQPVEYGQSLFAIKASPKK